MRTDLDAYDYDLPPELIAQRPLAVRDSSRLLVVDRNGNDMKHLLFADLETLLQPGDVMVVNDTRVIPARLRGIKAGTGAAVELLLLDELGGGVWQAIGRPTRRLGPGSQVLLGDGTVVEIVDRGDDGQLTVRLDSSALERCGEVPLPPYINESLSDRDRYQTVYAQHPGSAAAPTAGLHFTPALLERVTRRGVGLARVTLHVGVDTFSPIREGDITRHHMHSERFTIPEAAAGMISRARMGSGRVVAVGTTVVRALEAGYLMADGIHACSGRTDLFIRPGFQFRVVSCLLTNFHLPRSSLLVLVSAFAGRERTLLAYREAISQGYRLFSFGDAMFIA